MPLMAFVLIFAAGGTIPADLRRLDSPVWPVRQRAEAELRSRMSWPFAIWLESQQPRLGAEGRARVNRLLAAYWYGWLPAERDLPYIDAINTINRCSTPNTPFVQRYLDRASAALCCSYPYPRYRQATWLLIDDLIRLRVPPPIIRNLLHMMQVRSDAWDRERGNGYRRMPTP